MPAFSDYVIYVDESGDHSLSKVDPAYPIFVLTFCIFRKSEFVSTIVPQLQDLKFRWFGHDAVILHEREIRQQVPPFKFLQIRSLQTRFMDELSAILGNSPMTIIASVIDKAALQAKYHDPSNPYQIGLQFCLERAEMHLRALGQDDRVTHCVFEKRGANEDRDLELEFRRICDGANYHHRRLDCLDVVFADKKINSSGLQIADLTARPIGLHVLRPGQPNRAFEVIEPKLRKNPEGKASGWGLKVFP